jgi:DNA polymerase elongation subunit (family B)
VRVYSGEKPYVTNKRTVVERPGNWYAPYLGALITAGGRLLLGMLERCVEGWGGTYAWADTDSLAVVSKSEGGNSEACARI